MVPSPWKNRRIRGARVAWAPKNSPVMVLFYFSVSIISQAIQGQVRVNNVNFVGKRRKKRQTEEQKTLITTVLTDEFCVKTQDSVSSCSIQNVQFQNAEGLSGTFVNFLIVISVDATTVSTVMTKLNDVNDNLTTNQGLEFVPGVISGNYARYSYGKEITGSLWQAL